MGSPAGAERTAAVRIGVSLDEYRGRRALGQKWCRLCSDWRPFTAFNFDRSRSDGRCATCAAHGLRTDAPSKRERSEMRSVGLAWCSDCQLWLPVVDVIRGRCGEHRRERERRWYADGGHVYRRGRTAARRRGVDAMPGDWREEYLSEGCAYCPATASAMDHFIPVARGGRTEPGNMVPACGPCNSRKRDGDPLDWLPRLAPRWQEHVLFHLTGDGPVADLLDA